MRQQEQQQEQEHDDNADQQHKVPNVAHNGDATGCAHDVQVPRDGGQEMQYRPVLDNVS